METIWNYLDNMFHNLPQTPEVLRAKEDLAEMMEDRYNELISAGKIQNEAIGIVISEFGNIQEIIDELGLSEEKSEKERFTEKDFEKQTIEDDPNTMRHVSALEADDYLFSAKQSAAKIGAGVFLCICSPVLLMLFSGMKAFVPFISDGVAIAAGLTALFCMVACAVGMFISAGMKMDAYEYLKKECFVLDPEYEQTIYQIWESYKKIFTVKIIAGVMLCICSVIPVIICSALLIEKDQNEFLMIVCVAFLLAIVGIGVFLFITAGMEEEAYEVILQKKDFTIRKKSGKKIEDIISAIYWPVVVIVYLVWSISSGSWGISWIIWPFAGIIFSVICKMVEKEKI